MKMAAAKVNEMIFCRQQQQWYNQRYFECDTHTHIEARREFSSVGKSAKMKIELNCTIYTLKSECESETAISFKMRSFADTFVCLCGCPSIVNFTICTYNLLSNQPIPFHRIKNVEFLLPRENNCVVAVGLHFLNWNIIYAKHATLIETIDSQNK